MACSPLSCQKTSAAVGRSLGRSDSMCTGDVSRPHAQCALSSLPTSVILPIRRKGAIPQRAMYAVGAAKRTLPLRQASVLNSAAMLLEFRMTVVASDVTAALATCRRRSAAGTVACQRLPTFKTAYRRIWRQTKPRVPPCVRFTSRNARAMPSAASSRSSCRARSSSACEVPRQRRERAALRDTADRGCMYLSRQTGQLRVHHTPGAGQRWSWTGKSGDGVGKGGWGPNLLQEVCELNSHIRAGSRAHQERAEVELRHLRHRAGSKLRTSAHPRSVQSVLALCPCPWSAGKPRRI